MTSQNSLHEILDSIALWSPEDISEKLGEIAPVLISSLEHHRRDTTLLLKCLQAMLVTSLPCVAIAEAETLLMQHAVPAAKQLFYQVIDEITTILQASVENIVGETLVMRIEVCLHVLDCLCSTTQYVASLCSVDCVLVQSVPKNVSLVLAHAFKHCKDSESLYGTLFEEMHDVLTALFQKCYQLQTQFLAAMTTVIKFNCFFEEELVLVTEVLESMSEIGQLTSSLDVKAMVDVWKGYTQLAETYCDHLKPRLDVAKPLVSLSEQVVSSLEATVCLVGTKFVLDVTGLKGFIALFVCCSKDAGEGKLITRNAKVVSFQLKVILKLCEQYADFLGDCHEHLVLLLLSLYRLSGCGLQLMDTDASVIDIVDRHAGIATEPLVASLLSDPSFAQNYFKVVALKKTGTSLSTVLLSVAVVKKLIHADSNTRKLWLHGQKNILDVVFQMIECLHSELSWQLQIPGVMSGGEPQRLVDLYEHLLTHLAGFIMSVSVGEFPCVEQTLLKNVLQTNAWKALLASDLWCVVARYGSAELCFQHVCRLSSVLEQMPPAEARPERVFLASLLGRLFPLLSTKHLAALPDTFPVPLHLDVWAVVPASLVPHTVAGQLRRHTLSCVDTWVKQPVSTDNYEAVVRSLPVVAGSVPAVPPDARLVTNVINLWHSVESAASQQGNNALPHWLHRLVFHLCNASIALLPHVNNHQLLQMLSGMKILAAVGCSSVKFCIIMAVRKLGDKIINADPDQAAVFQLIAGLFSSLLKERNALLSEAILEAFEYFAHVTQHAEIVATSVMDDERSQQKVALYLQKILPSQQPTLPAKQYFSHQSQVEYVHKCCVTATVTSQEIQPVKKFKSDSCEEHVNKSVQQFVDMSKQIVGYVLQKRVPWNKKEMLIKSAREILKWTEEQEVVEEASAKSTMHPPTQTIDLTS